MNWIGLLVSIELVLVGIYMLVTPSFSKRVRGVLALAAWIPLAVWSEANGGSFLFATWLFWIPLLVGIVALVVLLVSKRGLWVVRAFGLWLLVYVAISGLISVMILSPEPDPKAGEKPVAQQSCTDGPIPQLNSAVDADRNARRNQSTVPPNDNDAALYWEQQVNITGARLEDIRDILREKRPDCLQYVPLPVADFTAISYDNGRTIELDASSSKGDALQYYWQMQDSDYSEILSENSHLPDSSILTDPRKFSYNYRGVPMDAIVLKVTDVYGRKSEPAVHRVAVVRPLALNGR